MTVTRHHLVFIAITILLLTTYPATAAGIVTPAPNAIEAMPIRSWTELRDTGITKQKFDYSCGAASLVTLLNGYFGASTNEVDVIDRVGIKPAFSMQDLATVADALGFETIPMALSYAALQRLQRPVIVYLGYWDDGHFSVLRKAEQDGVWLADPAWGNVRMARKRFEAFWNTRSDASLPGRVLALRPKPDAVITIDDTFIKPHVATAAMMPMLPLPLALP